jgi:hypothetical protein
MKKNLVQYKADIDYETTIQSFRQLHSRFGDFSLEVTGGRGRAGAQIVACFKEWDLCMNIYATGLIQIAYKTIPNLRKGVQVLEHCCVPNTQRFELKAFGPDDPLDNSVELTTIYHWRHTDKKYAMAKVRLYWWWDPKTDVYVCRIPDREGRVHAPEGSYVFDCCVPVTIHVVDKYDGQGNRIVTAEKLRWKAIQELRRIAKEHSRVKFQDGRAVDFDEDR